MDESDSSVSSQSEKPADPSETVQLPTDPIAETRPEPGSAESDGGPPETQNPSQPSTSTAADNEVDQSQTRVQDSGPDPDTRDRGPAGEEVQLRPEESGEKKVNWNEESEFEEIISSEARRTEHNNDPDSGPSEPAKRSRTGPPGKD